MRLRTTLNLLSLYFGQAIARPGQLFPRNNAPSEACLKDLSYNANAYRDCTDYLCTTVTPTRTVTIQQYVTVTGNTLTETSTVTVASTTIEDSTVTATSVIVSASRVITDTTLIETSIIAAASTIVTDETVIDTSVVVSTSITNTIETITATSATDVTDTSTLTSTVLVPRDELPSPSHSIPSYASACSSPSQYKSACSCIGAPAKTITATPITVTITKQCTVKEMATTIVDATSVSLVTGTSIVTTTTDSISVSLATDTSTVTSITDSISVSTVTDTSVITSTTDSTSVFLITSTAITTASTTITDIVSTTTITTATAQPTNTCANFEPCSPGYTSFGVQVFGSDTGVDCNIASMFDFGGSGDNLISFQSANGGTTFTLSGTTLINAGQYGSVPIGLDGQGIQFDGTPGMGLVAVACEIDPVASIFTCQTDTSGSPGTIFSIFEDLSDALVLGTNGQLAGPIAYLSAICPT